MKKLLAVFLMPFLIQSLLQGQPKQYKYLNRLSEDSQLKKKCESLGKSWLRRSNAEYWCDELDDSYEIYTETMRGNKEYEHKRIKRILWKACVLPRKVAVRTEMSEMCSSVIEHIFSEMNQEDHKKERALLLLLTHKIEEEVNPLE